MSVLLPAIVPPIEVRRWTLDEYHRMIEGGYLDEDELVELLKGWIVPKMPHNPDHDLAIEDAEDLLTPLLPKGWKIRIQCALSIMEAESEPEPDLTVCTPKNSRRGRHPRAADTPFIAEISDSSLGRDRTLKLSIYALAQIPVYWIINLPDRQVEVYTDPTGPVANPKYRKRRYFRNGSTVPVVIAGKEIGRIPVSALLPS